MKILHMSDCHLRGDGKLSFGVADTVTSVNHIINHITALRQQPDIIMITGDLGDNGNPIAYQLLKEKLSVLNVPIYAVPGNHDKRELFFQTFGAMCPVKEDILPYICYTIDNYPIKIIAIDTTIPGKHWGGLSDEVASWLEEKIQAFMPYPTLVFTHHPPFLTGLTMMDEPFENQDRLAKILSTHPNLRLCCGHMHRGIMTQWRGIQVMTCPPVSMLIELDISEVGGDTFYLADPSYAIHHLCADQINTHFCIVPTQATYSGPHPFAYID